MTRLRLLPHPFALSLSKCRQGVAKGLRQAQPKRAGVLVMLLATSTAEAIPPPPPPQLPPPPPACGIDYSYAGRLNLPVTTRDDAPYFHSKVVADPRFKRSGGDPLHEIWSAESIQAIWTFVTPKHRAFPAAVCQQVIDRGGMMQIDRTVFCDTGFQQCAEFKQELEAAEDSSGDGE